MKLFKIPTLWFSNRYKWIGKEDKSRAHLMIVVHQTTQDQVVVILEAPILNRAILAIKLSNTLEVPLVEVTIVQNR
jgi:hypothetical protein